jgi:hypothetical protein
MKVRSEEKWVLGMQVVLGSNPHHHKKKKKVRSGYC